MHFQSAYGFTVAGAKPWRWLGLVTATLRSTFLAVLQPGDHAHLMIRPEQARAVELLFGLREED